MFELPASSLLRVANSAEWKLGGETRSRSLRVSHGVGCGMRRAGSIERNTRVAMDKCADNPQCDGMNPRASVDVPLHYLAKRLAALLDTAQREFESNREAAKASLVAASSILQSEIERSSGASGSRPGALAGWQITRVRAFIEQNLHGNIGARHLSALAQRSPAHFSRSFKQAFGEPPHAYVIKRRLERACHLMITTSDSLSAIALSVGLSDQAHLCKLFQRAFGQSPSIWRRYHKIKESISSVDIGKECQGRLVTKAPGKPVGSIAIELG
jgi:AraC family transcriptional regulator